MKLASLIDGGRDGTLVVVNRALDRAVRVTEGNDRLETFDLPAAKLP